MIIHHNLLRNHKFLLNLLNTSATKSRLSHDLAVLLSNEPKYPPITDASPEGVLKHERMKWYDSLKSLPTVEQKFYEIAAKKNPATSAYTFGSCMPTFAGIPFQHYITRTHLINGLPDRLTAINVDEELGSLTQAFCEVLSTHYFNPWEINDSKQLSDHLNEEHCGSKLVTNLLSECCKKLALAKDYILQSTFQQFPEVSSFWWHGGFKTKIPNIEQRCLLFNFNDIPLCTIRMKKPLPQILPLDDALCATAEVENYNYSPKVLGITEKKYFQPKCSPGYWAGDPYEFPLLQVYSSNRMSKLISEIEYYDLQDLEDGLGVMASFGWLNAVAQYQGFLPFQQLTYPFVGHTILTNGQDWTFYTYQLNTSTFHEDVDMNDRRNICWSSGKLRLFETIENGQVKGINDEVFATLLRLFLYAPEMNSQVELKPFLGVDTRSAEEILTMKKELHYMMKNFKTPGRHYANDIPFWQRIYKFHKDAPPSPMIRME